MKGTLKNILFSALGAVSLMGAITLQSCEEDKCKAISCANGGSCEDGYCACPSGYEGNLCETVERSKFIGVWNVFEDGTITDPAQYPVSVEPGTSINTVQIKNMYNNFFASVDATIKGDSIKILPQTKDNKQIEGYGWVEEDKYYDEHGKMIMIYKVTDGPTVDEFGTSPNTKSSLWNK